MVLYPPYYIYFKVCCLASAEMADEPLTLNVALVGDGLTATAGISRIAEPKHKLASVTETRLKVLLEDRTLEYWHHWRIQEH